jgi:two-component sensor histidine kinase/CHASE1-domain containing sensor protein
MVRRSVEQRDRAAFDSDTRLASMELQKRVDSYERVIRSTGQIFYIVPHAGPETFFTYVKGLDLMRQYPGIRGIGVSIRVPKGKKGLRAFLDMLEQNGMRNFRIWPEGQREEYHTVICLYPDDDWSKRGIGYDMHTEPVKAEAMDRARDTGRATVSDVTVLVQDKDDDRQPGFLIYTPLYLSRNIPPKEKRDKLLISYVYAPFRTRNVFADLVRMEARKLIQFKVNSVGPDGEDPIFHSWESAKGVKPFSDPRFSRTLPIRVTDRWWKITFMASPDYREGAGAALTTLLAVSGSSVSLLLFGIMLYQSRSQKELDQRRKSIELLNEHLQGAMRETHHRVKNNLQVIAAMIDMQAMDADPVSEPQLRRLAMHVTGLSAVHDILTDQARIAGDADGISARQILEKLLKILEPLSLGRPLVSEIDDAQLSTRQGTSLAIVTNELVSNALKHGRGAVEIRFTARNGTAHLEVEDDGPGFPAGFEPERSANTGLQLVSSLSSWDLGGSARFENRPSGGARVSIDLPLRVTEKITENTQIGA